MGAFSYFRFLLSDDHILCQVDKTSQHSNLEKKVSNRAYSFRGLESRAVEKA